MQVPIDAGPPRRDRFFFVFNGVVSAAAVLFLSWLLYAHKAGGAGADLSFLPAVNAGLNAPAAALLLAGWLAVRSGHRRLHRFLMVSALAASALFLMSYVAYHYAHGDTKFAGTGGVKVLYLAVLASHVLLSMAVVPLALTLVYLAAQRRLPTHRKVARVALPLWLYVSVTGVVIFALLRAYAP